MRGLIRTVTRVINGKRPARTRREGGTPGSESFRAKRGALFRRLGIPDPGTVHSVHAADDRETHCYVRRCGLDLTSRANPKCRKCGWLICKVHASCSCTRSLFN
jgi:hypothetical protein